jgi:hypothetical protein
MRTRNNLHIGQESLKGHRFIAPQDRNHFSAASAIQNGDCRIGESRPTGIEVGGRCAKRSREVAIEQHDALARPSLKIATVRHISTQVIAQLAHHVLQTSRQRANLGRNRKRKAYGVTRARVWVLPNQQHANRVNALLERPHHHRQRWGYGGIRAHGSFNLIEQITLAGKSLSPTGVHLLEEHGSSLGVPE